MAATPPLRTSHAIVLSALGFLGTNALVRAWSAPRRELRFPPASLEGRKFAEFRRQTEDYDLVYVGTSRVLRGFDPHAFDARLAELGVRRNSYNLGFVGMGFLEELELVTWLLDHHAPNLKTLVVDPTDREAGIARGNWSSARTIAWHDLEATARGIGMAWSSEAPWTAKAEMSVLRLCSALRRGCLLGVGANLLAGALDEPPTLPRLIDGFGPREANASEGLAEPEVSGGSGPREPELFPSEAPWLALQELARRAARAGVELHFVVPPTQRALGPFLEAEARGFLPGLITFPPREYRDLFVDQDTYFYDQGHLNSLGAHWFSRRLAELLAPRLASD